VRGHPAEGELVDMRDEAAEGNTKPLSRRLVEVVTRALENEEQTILYLNRRGLATYVMCRDCGRSVQCLGCSVALVQHAEIGGLVCHYCGYARAMPSVCDFCGSRNIRGLGLGTQRL
jgi:primosomal protein N' (replication factor Y)